MKIKIPKKPDRIILLELGAIAALLFVNYAFTIQYRSDSIMEDPFANDKEWEVQIVLGKFEPEEPNRPEPQPEKHQAIELPVDLNKLKLVPDLFKLPKTGPVLKPKFNFAPVAHLNLTPAVDSSSTIIDAPMAEKMPEFPGGETALSKFIVENYRVPDIVTEVADQVFMTVEFVLDEEGKVVEIQILNCTVPGFGAEREARRVYQAMPRWTPALYNGKPTKIRVRQPLKIKIDD